METLDPTKLEDYQKKKKKNRPHLETVPTEQLYELTGVLKGGKVTLSAVMLFGYYPQAYFPQLSVIATCVPSTEMGILDETGQRFTDSRRIEGTRPEMLEGSLAFVRTNMRTATTIDPKTGARRDTPQYPMDAVREAVLNALVHRDYSIHTEGMPIQLTMYADRLEVSNPGGLYGRLTVDQLGHVQPDTRNPVLVTAMEVLEQTENRYSGIPRIRHAMAELSLPEPVFSDQRGTFTVTLYNRRKAAQQELEERAEETQQDTIYDPKGLLVFCQEPRTRKEVIEYLQISSAQYALHRYLEPLVKCGAIRLTIPEKPKSPKQKYVTAARKG